MLGMLAAGIICLIVGFCVYFAAKTNVVALLTGMFAVAMGAIIAGAAVIVLIIFLIITLIAKAKNKKD